MENPASGFWNNMSSVGQGEVLTWQWCYVKSQGFNEITNNIFGIMNVHTTYHDSYNCPVIIETGIHLA